MIKYLFKNAEFVKSALAAKDYPLLKGPQGFFLPEIAVVGRSNVGKSTLLNDLFQSKRLVKTSSQPGKTQTINFFTLNQQLSFVDLPGYGYAQVCQSIQKQWGPMVESYLNSRDYLKLILFLLDIRRIPSVEDLQLMAWIRAKQIPSLLILTKVDKVNLSEKKQQTEHIIKTFSENGFESINPIHYSAPKKEGRHQLINQIISCLN